MRKGLAQDLHLSSLADREAVLHQVQQYIEETSALLGNDLEAKEFTACLAALADMIAEDVEQGQFGSDPTIEQAQMKYLRSLQQQFSLPPPR